ncbi:MAG: hypothetical protein JSR47_19080, partial [Proteobacteria bacterium]|nr:hypothetical protein [Pseudomonadota bacterium]
AEQGQGTTLNGARVTPARPAELPSGLIGDRIRKEFDRQLTKARRDRLGELTTLRCAGREYIEILTGQYDFNLYRMTKPWDHAAGALMLAEAGGGALRFNGAPYGPADRIESGIIGAASLQVLAGVRAIFETVQLPLLAPRA